MRRLRNSTNIPDEWIRAVEKFILPPGGVGSYDLEVRNTAHGSYTGHAYTQGSGYHDTARPFIVLRLGEHGWPQPPERERPRGGYLPIPWLGSREEAFVHLFAHELRHLWQARVPRGRRVWGARGQFSERDADAYAIRMLRAFRRASALDEGALPAAVLERIYAPRLPIYGRTA